MGTGRLTFIFVSHRGVHIYIYIYMYIYICISGPQYLYHSAIVPLMLTGAFYAREFSGSNPSLRRQVLHVIDRSDQAPGGTWENPGDRDGLDDPWIHGGRFP